jgi:hypothetical protein
MEDTGVERSEARGTDGLHTESKKFNSKKRK